MLIATIVPSSALADEPERQPKVDFIGVFRPVPVAFGADPVRCPEPSHRLLLTFQGIAYTTLGRATFTQSHCQAADHSSFRRGEQTITFDNGDQLFGSYSGVLLPTPTTATDGRLIIDGIYRNVGGTGALEHAHGRGISIGIVDTATGFATVTVSGKL
jgi:hypothetical protein